MLFEGFAPPAARQTSAVFFIVIAPTEILHFYLELADERERKIVLYARDIIIDCRDEMLFLGLSN